MGSVTKTITEYVGEVSSSTGYHFESFEDFKEYERSLSYQNDEIVIQSDRDVTLIAKKIEVSGENEEEWIPNPGYQPAVGEYTLVDILWNDKEVTTEVYANHYQWALSPRLGLFITHYKLSKKEKNN